MKLRKSLKTCLVILRYLFYTIRSIMWDTRLEKRNRIFGVGTKRETFLANWSPFFCPNYTHNVLRFECENNF